MITYTEEKRFTQEQVVDLFQAVHWHSADYPSRLYKALMNSQTVITDGRRRSHGNLERCKGREDSRSGFATPGSGTCSGRNR